jgi:hypothetical protein
MDAGLTSLRYCPRVCMLEFTQSNKLDSGEGSKGRSFAESSNMLACDTETRFGRSNFAHSVLNLSTH